MSTRFQSPVPSCATFRSSRGVLGSIGEPKMPGKTTMPPSPAFTRCAKAQSTCSYDDGSMSSTTTVTRLYRNCAALEPQRAAAICLGWPWHALVIWTTMFTPLVIGGTETARTHVMQASVRMFRVIAAGWTENAPLYALYEACN